MQHATDGRHAPARRNCAVSVGVVWTMNPWLRTFAALAILIAAVMTAGCATPGGSPSPTPGVTPSPIPPSPTMPPELEVGSPAQAAALVLAHAGFGRMQPLLPNLIGQSAWYEAFEDDNGFAVKITVGAGDCQAGCIERHTWNYTVARDGTITLVSDEGDPVPIPPATGSSDPLRLDVSLMSGPTCPVQRDPPDPNCGPRPVVNAEVAVFDTSGQQVASGVSGDDGSVALQLPAGAYYVAPQQIEGFMGQAAPLAFAGVGGDNVTLIFEYDTGIR